MTVKGQRKPLSFYEGKAQKLCAEKKLQFVKFEPRLMKSGTGAGKTVDYTHSTVHASPCRPLQRRGPVLRECKGLGGAPLICRSGSCVGEPACSNSRRRPPLAAAARRRRPPPRDSPQCSPAH